MIHEIGKAVGSMTSKLTPKKSRLSSKRRVCDINWRTRWTAGKHCLHLYLSSIQYYCHLCHLKLWQFESDLNKVLCNGSTFVCFKLNFFQFQTLKDTEQDLHIFINIISWVKSWRAPTASSLYFVHRYAHTHIETQRPHHHIVIRMASKIKILNSCVYFYFKFSLQVFASTQWNENNNITTYWQTSLAGLNDEHVQMFLHWVAFAGVRNHTFIDRPRHHHILVDKHLMGEVLKRCHYLFI